MTACEELAGQRSIQQRPSVRQWRYVTVRKWAVIAALQEGKMFFCSDQKHKHVRMHTYTHSAHASITQLIMSF